MSESDSCIEIKLYNTKKNTTSDVILTLSIEWCNAVLIVYGYSDFLSIALDLPGNRKDSDVGVCEYSILQYG